ncbi:hypothetical protein LWI28_009321 [Acer negundo]|uniref:Uncharacterized protein n=1 Tax=Acer negundo TaxID=4023 RepID=A0AAD5ILY5_ACENE|nr:hypothetical protein LWI28_009321 [Acer negundo]
MNGNQRELGLEFDYGPWLRALGPPSHCKESGQRFHRGKTSPNQWVGRDNTIWVDNGIGSPWKRHHELGRDNPLNSIRATQALGISKALSNLTILTLLLLWLLLGKIATDVVA